jgi:hypothetical protein
VGQAGGLLSRHHSARHYHQLAHNLPSSSPTYNMSVVNAVCISGCVQFLAWVATLPGRAGRAAWQQAQPHLEVSHLVSGGQASQAQTRGLPEQGPAAGAFMLPGNQQGALGGPTQAGTEAHGTSEPLVRLLMDAATDVFDGSQGRSQGAGGTGGVTGAGGHTPILVSVLPGGRGTQDLDGTRTFEHSPPATAGDSEGVTTASPTAATPGHSAPVMVHPVCLVYGQPCSLTIAVPVSSVLAALQHLQGDTGTQQWQGPVATHETSIRVLLVQGDQVILDQAAEGSVPGAGAAAAQGSTQLAGMQGGDTQMLIIRYVDDRMFAEPGCWGTASATEFHPM